MNLDAPAIVRVGLAVNACYGPDFLEHPERARLPGQIAVVWGADGDGPRPYGVVARDDSLDATLLLLRGTDSLAEWESDADAALVDCPFLPGARTHRGFTGIWSSLRASGSDLAPYLRAIGRPLVVAGHSLGAALATLCAAETGGADLVTFAGPRVGDDAFARMAASRMASNARIVNAPDFVPRLPARLEPLFPYAHVGHEIIFDSGGKTTANPHAWHDLSTYLHLIDSSVPIDPRFAPPSP